MKTMNSTIQTPAGARWLVFGAYHKVGEFDRIYIHNGFEWISSSKTLKQIIKEVKLTGIAL